MTRKGIYFRDNSCLLLFFLLCHRIPAASYFIIEIPEMAQKGICFRVHSGFSLFYSNHLTMLGIPFNSFWIYSRLAIFALVSSRFKRRVLSELNSSIVASFMSPSLKYLS